jgi:inorganic pyrophosphatase
MNYNILGKSVTVTIDRPLGTFHPRKKTIFYTVNYGYVEGIIAGDGAEQDAYVIGVDRPVETFIGVVVAVIHRLDDVEDKWVVAPEDVILIEDEIKKAVHFVEQFFKSEYYCLYS